MAPRYIEKGDGPGVVCLHANAGTSGQWRPLMERLAPRFRVLAPDTLGAGRNPPWPQDRPLTLGKETAFLAPVFDEAGVPFSLVGHSYGGAIALIAALRRPSSVSSLVVYEPTLFSLLREQSPQGHELLDIQAVAEAAAADVEAGDLDSAARRFIDYWMGDGSWDAVPEQRRGPMANAMRNVGGWAHALIHDPTPLSSLQRLDIPILCLVGERSPISSRGVVRFLATALPRLEVVELEGLGHMAPLTHPDRVNPLIDDFLSRTLARGVAR